jgi:hypothetical protein
MFYSYLASFHLSFPLRESSHVYAYLFVQVAHLISPIFYYIFTHTCGREEYQLTCKLIIEGLEREGLAT